MMRNRLRDRLLIIDGHVHIHQCFNLAQFFDAAYTNCEVQATHHQVGEHFQGVLLLTESSWDHWFAALQSYAEKSRLVHHGQTSEWTIHFTGDPEALLAQSSTGRELVVISGRQIVTKEKLEVLALITDQPFQDGMPIREAIDAVHSVKGIAVVPWGFGKWWGSRGKILSELIQSSASYELALGDNSGRPSFLSYPSQFEHAYRRGMRILPGSDPLPFPSEYWRPCSVGFSLMGTMRSEFPASDLRGLLGNHQTTLMPFMRGENGFRFIKNQLAMLMVKQPRS